MPLHFEVCPDNQQDATDQTAVLEALNPTLLDHSVEFHDAGGGQQDDDGEKNIVGEEFVTGKHRPENDRPQNDGAQEPASEDASLGQGRRAARFVIRHIRID